MTDLNDTLIDITRTAAQLHGDPVQDALALAIVNKDKAENELRLARIEIQRLNVLIVNAMHTFDEIAQS